jgi:uncharacterized membrane protein HdeD (DUF308 family)
LIWYASETGLEFAAPDLINVLVMEVKMMDKSMVEPLGRDWGWVLAAGIGLILLGFVTLSWPVSSTVGLTFALGVMLLASGVVLGIHAIQSRQESGSGWRIVQALVSCAAGVLMLRYPGAGMQGVAIALTFYFFVSATVRALLALELRPVRGWGWVFASAIATGVLGLYILMTLPFAALWVPGFLFGLDLLMYGASLVGISFDLKHLHRSLSHLSRTTGSVAHVR